MQLMSDDLHQLAESVWQTFKGAAPSSYVPGAVPVGSGEWMTGTVAISGAWTGTVAVSCRVESVRRQAAQMFEIPLDSVGPVDLRDALAEIVNVLGGNLKSLLPAPTSLGLPEVVSPQPQDEASGAERPLVKGTFFSPSGPDQPYHVAVVQTERFPTSAE